MMVLLLMFSRISSLSLRVTRDNKQIVMVLDHQPIVITVYDYIPSGNLRQNRLSLPSLLKQLEEHTALGWIDRDGDLVSDHARH